MRPCCVASTECLDVNEVSDTLEKDISDSCVDEPTSIAWAVKRAPHDGNVVIVALECNTRHNWAVRTSAVSSRPFRPADSSRHGRSPWGWACRGTMTAVHEGASSHKIALSHNPLLDWAVSATHCWLRGRSVSGRATVGHGIAHLLQEPAGVSSVILNGLGRPGTVVPVQAAQEPPAGEVPSPGAHSPEPMRPPGVKQALPYSVPTLAIGDVFLACNTVVGLENADDWDLSALSSGLFRGYLDASGNRADNGAGAEGIALPSSTNAQPHGASRRYLLDPASDMLLRMSSLIGGQRLMFVSKESAELVRRALLLSRYDEIMAERTAAGEKSAGEPTGEAAATTSPMASRSCLPWINGDASGFRAKRGWASVDDNGDDEAPRQGLVPWLRRSRVDRATTHASPPVLASTLPATSTKPGPNPSAGVTMLNTNSAENSGESGHVDDNGSSPNTVTDGGGGGHGTSTQDIFQLDLPDWIPGPMRKAATATIREVGAWVVQSGSSSSGGGNGTVGGIQQSLALLFRRGVNGDGGSSGSVLDVSTGPRPRLPSPPLTGPMQLPPLPGAAAAAAGDRKDEQHLQHLKENRGRPEAAVPGDSGQADVVRGSAPERASSDFRLPWDSEAVFQELKQLEEEKVIADAEALLRAEKRGTAGRGGSSGESDGGFLPPFSFSSYVARLPLEAALKALLSTHMPTAVTDAGAAEATVPVPSAAATGVSRRFLLVPDSVDEQAVEGSREIDRLVAEVEAAAAAAAAEEAGGRAVGNVAFPELEGEAGFRSGHTIASTVGRTATVRSAAPRPRVALNLYDSDASHWVLDVVDELEQEGSEVASSISSSGSNGNSQPLSLPAERFIKGAPSGPSDDLGGLVQLPNSPLEPTASGVHDIRTLAATPRTSATAATSASASQSDDAAATSTSTSSDGSSTSSGGGTGGRTPVFVLPGVTVSVRAADGSLLRLRPAFLSLQQLAAALTLVRDAAVASWRRQRSLARWRVVSALDVLTVHSAGFPIIRFPPPSSNMGGGGGTSGAGGAGGDEDSDDGIPEAKELLREMGAGNRRPSAIDAAAASAHSQEAPSGVLGVLSTLAVGVVSFSAWCLVSAIDVWEDIYFRTPWGLEEIGVPQHVNVRPTYLEEHVRRLAEANVPAVAAAAAAAARSKAVKRAQEKRARRRQAQAQRPAATQEHQHQQATSNTIVTEQTMREQVPSANSLSAPGNVEANHQSSVSETNPGAASSLPLPPSMRARDGAVSEASGSSAASATTAGSENSGSPEPAKGNHNAQRQRGAAAAAATAAAVAAHAPFSGLKLQTETMAGLTILFQFAWAAASAAHLRARREADGILVSGSGGGAVDGLLRLVGGRSPRDGGLPAGGGGGGGLTLTASQEGELALMAKLDIRPVASATLPRTAAAAEKVTGASEATTGNADSNGVGTAAASGQQVGSGVVSSAGEPMEVEAKPGQTRPLHQQQQQQRERSTSSPSSAVGPPASPAAAGLPKSEGLSVKELGPTGQSSLRYELLQSSAKLASQLTRPHKFEVGFHLNLRKLMGDLPEEAPDHLLKLQQPAGPVPSGAAAAAAAAAAVGGHRNLAQGQATSPEAHGLLLIGDLGLEEVEGGFGARLLSLGYADLGELFPRPGSGAHLDLSSCSAADAVGRDLIGGPLVGSSEDYSDSEGGAGDSGGGRGKVGAVRNSSGGAAIGVGSRGWAAGGRGGWGRWGR